RTREGRESVPECDSGVDVLRNLLQLRELSRVTTQNQGSARVDTAHSREETNHAALLTATGEAVVSEGQRPPEGDPGIAWPRWPFCLERIAEPGKHMAAKQNGNPDDDCRCGGQFCEYGSVNAVVYGPRRLADHEVKDVNRPEHDKHHFQEEQKSGVLLR